MNYLSFTQLLVPTFLAYYIRQKNIIKETEFYCKIQTSVRVEVPRRFRLYKMLSYT